MTPAVVAVMVFCGIIGVALIAWALSKLPSASDKPPPAPLPLDVRHLCECCDEPATRYRPVIERSALDRDPFGHKRLHNLPPMYVIGTQDDRPRLCAAHERLIRQWNEEELAKGRALTAQHNSILEQRYARLVNELVARAQLQAHKDEEAVHAIRHDDEVPRLLPAAPQSQQTVTLLASKPPPGDDES